MHFKPYSAASRTGSQTHVHYDGRPAILARRADRWLIDLQFGRFGNRTGRHRSERKTQRLGFEARQAANFQADAYDPSDLVPFGLPVEKIEQMLTDRHFMHSHSVYAVGPSEIYHFSLPVTTIYDSQRHLPENFIFYLVVPARRAPTAESTRA